MNPNSIISGVPGTPAFSQDARLLRHIHTDKIFAMVLSALFLLSLCLAPLYDTWTIALAAGLPLLLIPCLLILTQPGQVITRMAVAVSLMLYCALHIQQTQGIAEMHFGIFVLLAFLLAYQDIRVILAAAATAAVHHLSFNYLQELNAGPICFTQASWATVFIHAAYVVVEAGILAYFVSVMNRDEQRAARGDTVVRMYQTMQSVVRNVHSNMQSINNVAIHIANSNAQLAARTDAQASSLEQTTRTLDEFTESVQTNTSNVQRARRCHARHQKQPTREMKWSAR